jgi:ribosomal protein S20
MHISMPLLKNSQKALRSSRRKAEMNSRVKSRVRTAMDATRKNPSPDTLSQAFSALDRGIKRHLLHPNKVARLKHQLSKLVTA